MPAPSSRRKILQLGGIAFAGGLVAKVSAQTAGRRRALALVGDRYHNSDYIRVALTKTFEGLNVDLDFTVHYDQLSQSLLKNYQLFLCLRDGMIWPGGYLGPDAYSHYEQGLENATDFPQAKPEMWLKEERIGGEGVRKRRERVLLATQQQSCVVVFKVLP